MKIAIVDDQLIWRELLLKKIRSYFREKEICVGIDLYKDYLVIEKMAEYELIFLDVDLQCDIDGFEIARKLQNNNYKGKIVFITFFTELARFGYRVNAFRYIDKSNEDELIEALNSLVKLSQSKMMIECKFASGENTVISTSDVEYIEICNRHIEYKLTNSKVVYRSGSLSEICEEIKEYGFIQVHRSYLANIEFIVGISRRGALLHSGAVIPIGRKYYDTVREKYARWQIYNGD